MTERERRLHGFAVLVALGDQDAATAAWQVALSAYPPQRALGHDTRADGRLRARVVHELQEPVKRRVDRLLHVDRQLPIEQRARLRALGASDAAIEGLSVLSPSERGLLVAATSERLDAHAVAGMTGRGEAATEQAIARASHQYLRAVQATLAGQPWIRRQPSGELADRVASAANAAGARRPIDDPHRAFLGWLASGARGRPDAAAAIHAVACSDCREALAVVGALAAVDPSRSVAPAAVTRVRVGASTPRWVRLAAPVSALVVLVIALALGYRPLITTDGVAGDVVPAPLAVLPEAPVTDSPPTAPTDEGTGPPTPGPATPQQPPGPGIGPGTGTGVGVASGTPNPLDPSSGSSASAPAAPSGGSQPPASEPPTVTAPPSTQPPATQPPPEPTPEPTPPPTAEPPEPTPTAAPAANCSNGLDDDGDLLIDLLDPGCALFGDEFAAP